MKINLWDKSFAHLTTPDGKYSISDNRKPRYIEYVRGQQDWPGVTLITDHHLPDAAKIRSRYKLGMLIETEHTSAYWHRAEEFIANVDKLLTYDDKVLEAFPDKTLFYPYGGCWILEDNIDMYSNQKDKLCCMLYSNKRKAPGHQFRHEVAGLGMDLFGSGANRPFSCEGGKDEILRPYMFSVVIENTRSKFYFSEKLIDTIMMGVIPIYWGATQIADFFDPRGMIQFNTKEQLAEILSTLTPELYDSMVHWATLNFERAYDYYCTEDWLYKNIFEDFDARIK